jgi:hypothetical protein
MMTERFHVRLAEHVHGGRVLAEATFEAAAVAFAEEWAPHPESGMLVLVVRDEYSGEERCFRIDLEGGIAAPCETA